jgi:hypothetical protein
VLVEVNKLVTNKIDYQIMENINENEETKACTIHVVVNSFKCRKCGSENIKERSGYKVCFDCGEHY